MLDARVDKYHVSENNSNQEVQVNRRLGPAPCWKLQWLVCRRITIFCKSRSVSRHSAIRNLPTDSAS